MRIYLDDRRRELADWVTKIQHLVGGVPLLWVGLSHMAGEGHESRAFAFLEIGIAAGVFVAFFKEAFAARRRDRATADHGAAHHGSVGWFDLAAGVLLIFEAFHSVHRKPAYLRPQFTLGLITLSMGLFHHRISVFRRRLRYLEFDEIGIRYRVGPFRRGTFLWNELSSLNCGVDTLTINRVHGHPRTLALTRFGNRQAICHAVTEQAIPLLASKVAARS